MTATAAEPRQQKLGRQPTPLRLGQPQQRASAPRCSTCAFFVESDSQGMAGCHRYPPVVRLPYDKITAHPYVSSDDWCGEHVHKETGRKFQQEARA